MRNLVRIPRGVDQDEPARLLAGPLSVSQPDALVEVQVFALDAVPLAAVSSENTRQGNAGRAVEQVGSVWNQMAEGVVEQIHDVFSELAAGPLIGTRSISVAVAQHDLPPGQGGLDPLGEVLAPVREHQQEFGSGVHRLVQVEQELAELNAKACASRLASGHDWQPPFPQKFCGADELSRFPRTLYALESDEETSVFWVPV